jgi:hypothetical protein
MKGIIAVAAAAAVAACSLTLGPEGDRAGGLEGGQQPGAIKGYNMDDPRIEVAVNGRDVTVRVTTYGGGCTARGWTDVSVSGLTADIRPFDYVAPAGTICTMQLLSFIHEASIRFDRSGLATLRIHGSDAGHGTGGPGGPIVVEREVRIP